MAGRKSFDLSATKVRSAITNGRYDLADVDHRSAWMRRLRDLVALQMSDLGGDDNASEAERILVRRAAMMTLQLEMMEQRFAANDGEATPPQIETYQRCANTLRRLLESLGLQRRQKDVTPDLRVYLDAKAVVMEAAE